MEAVYIKHWLLSICVIVFMMHMSDGSQDLKGPPQRPDVFRNPEELRDYLRALNEYFAIMGRPRFGRSVPTDYYGEEDKRAFSTFNGLDFDGDGLVTNRDISYFRRYFS